MAVPPARAFAFPHSKGRRHPSLLLTAILLVGIGGCGDNTIEPQLDSVDVAAFSKLQLVFDTIANHADAIWLEREAGQTYRLDTTPLIWMRLLDDFTNVDPDGYLIHHPSPHGLELFHPAFDGMAPVYRQRVTAELLDLRNERTYRLNVTLGGVNTFVFSYVGDPGVTADPRSSDFLTYLVHEGFHRYQFYDGGWTRYPDWVTELESYPIVRGNVSLALLEERILVAGLRAASPAEVEIACRQFFAVRVARRRLPEVVVDGIQFVDQSDHALEHYEGTARYVQDRFLEAAGLATHELTVAQLAAELDATFTRDLMVPPAAGEVRFHFESWRFYRTGAALGLLLDELDVDWKSAARHGRSQFQVLETMYSNLTETELATLVADAKQAHEFDGIIAAATEYFLSPSESIADRATRPCIEPALFGQR
jgi:hypothetical protein